jgi:hypothetical protein
MGNKIHGSCFSMDFLDRYVLTASRDFFKNDDSYKVIKDSV